MSCEFWNGGIIFASLKRAEQVRGANHYETLVVLSGGLEVGSSEVIETLGSLEKGDFKGDKKEGSATC